MQDSSKMSSSGNAPTPPEDPEGQRNKNRGFQQLQALLLRFGAIRTADGSYSVQNQVVDPEKFVRRVIESHKRRKEEKQAEKVGNDADKTSAVPQQPTPPSSSSSSPADNGERISDSPLRDDDNVERRVEVDTSSTPESPDSQAVDAPTENGKDDTREVPQVDNVTEKVNGSSDEAATTAQETDRNDNGENGEEPSAQLPPSCPTETSNVQDESRTSTVVDESSTSTVAVNDDEMDEGEIPDTPVSSVSSKENEMDEGNVELVTATLLHPEDQEELEEGELVISDHDQQSSPTRLPETHSHLNGVSLEDTDTVSAALALAEIRDDIISGRRVDDRDDDISEQTNEATRPSVIATVNSSVSSDSEVATTSRKRASDDETTNSSKRNRMTSGNSLGDCEELVGLTSASNGEENHAENSRDSPSSRAASSNTESTEVLTENGDRDRSTGSCTPNSLTDPIDHESSTTSADLPVTSPDQMQNGHLSSADLSVTSPDQMQNGHMSSADLPVASPDQMQNGHLSSAEHSVASSDKSGEPEKQVPSVTAEDKSSDGNDTHSPTEVVGSVPPTSLPEQDSAQRVETEIPESQASETGEQVIENESTEAIENSSTETAPNRDALTADTCQGEQISNQTQQSSTSTTPGNYPVLSIPEDPTTRRQSTTTPPTVVVTANESQDAPTTVTTSVPTPQPTSATHGSRSSILSMPSLDLEDDVFTPCENAPPFSASNLSTSTVPPAAEATDSEERVSSPTAPSVNNDTNSIATTEPMEEGEEDETPTIRIRDDIFEPMTPMTPAYDHDSDPSISAFPLGPVPTTQRSTSILASNPLLTQAILRPTTASPPIPPMATTSTFVPPMAPPPTRFTPPVAPCQGVAPVASIPSIPVSNQAPLQSQPVAGPSTQPPQVSSQSPNPTEANSAVSSQQDVQRDMQVTVEHVLKQLEKAMDTFKQLSSAVPGLDLSESIKALASAKETTFTMFEAFDTCEVALRIKHPSLEPPRSTRRLQDIKPTVDELAQYFEVLLDAMMLSKRPNINQKMRGVLVVLITRMLRILGYFMCEKKSPQVSENLFTNVNFCLMAKESLVQKYTQNNLAYHFLSFWQCIRGSTRGQPYNQGALLDHVNLGPQAFMDRVKKFQLSYERTLKAGQPAAVAQQANNSNAQASSSQAPSYPQVSRSQINQQLQQQIMHESRPVQQEVGPNVVAPSNQQQPQPQNYTYLTPAEYNELQRNQYAHNPQGAQQAHAAPTNRMPPPSSTRVQPTTSSNRVPPTTTSSRMPPTTSQLHSYLSNGAGRTSTTQQPVNRQPSPHQNVHHQSAQLTQQEMIRRQKYQQQMQLQHQQLQQQRMASVSPQQQQSVIRHQAQVQGQNSQNPQPGYAPPTHQQQPPHRIVQQQQPRMRMASPNVPQLGRPTLARQASPYAQQQSQRHQPLVTNITPAQTHIQQNVAMQQQQMPANLARAQNQQYVSQQQNVAFQQQMPQQQMSQQQQQQQALLQQQTQQYFLQQRHQLQQNRSSAGSSRSNSQDEDITIVHERPSPTQSRSFTSPINQHQPGASNQPPTTGTASQPSFIVEYNGQLIANVPIDPTAQSSREADLGLPANTDSESMNIIGPPLHNEQMSDANIAALITSIPTTQQQITALANSLPSALQQAQQQQTAALQYPQFQQVSPGMSANNGNFRVAPNSISNSNNNMNLRNSTEQPLNLQQQSQQSAQTMQFYRATSPHNSRSSVPLITGVASNAHGSNLPRVSQTGTRSINISQAQDQANTVYVQDASGNVYPIRQDQQQQLQHQNSATYGNTNQSSLGFSNQQR